MRTAKFFLILVMCAVMMFALVACGEQDADYVYVRQNGGILLDMGNIYGVGAIQLYTAMYAEPVTFIGYPTADGSAGCRLYTQSLCGILTKSDNKDGAWAFIESFLTGEVSKQYGSVSALTDRMEAEIERSSGIRGGHILGTWTFESHPATQEEIQKLKELIAVARPVNTRGNDELMTIIEEEADAYFQGQKSIDDVVDIIQNRAQIYISENN